MSGAYFLRGPDGTISFPDQFGAGKKTINKHNTDVDNYRPNMG